VSESKLGDAGGSGVVCMMKNCKGMEEKLAELLLEPGAESALVKAHLEACAHCRRELDELRATMGLLDTWEAPEPSPYFLSKLDVRMREERRAAPAGWLARWRTSFSYGPTVHVRPVAAMALTVVLLVGGGAYLGLNDMYQASAPDHAAVVHDLQNLDNNAQLLDQMEALSSKNETGD